MSNTRTREAAQLDRIRNNIDAAYIALEALGVEVPEGATVDELAAMINDAAAAHWESSATEILERAKESGEFDGADGYTPQRGTDYWTPEDETAIKDDAHSYIVNELAKRGQLKPEFAESVDWLDANGDQGKMYVLPDGYVYAYLQSDAPAYTNVLAAAQTSASDTAPFNATGFQKDLCFTNSAATEDASSFAPQMTGGTNMITGFIPISASDKLYFDKAYVFSFSSSRFYNWFYDANGSKLLALRPNQISSIDSAVTMGENNNVVCLDLAVLATLSGFSSMQYAKYVRFSLQTDGSNPSEAVITINEPIASGGGTQYQWASTGINFVSMDALNELQEQIDDHEERIAALEIENTPVRIIAPPKLTVIAGHELNVYTENMVICDNLANYEVRWSFTGNLNGVALAMDDCLRFPASITGVMTDTATLRIRDKITGETITSAQIPVEVIAEPTLSGKKVVFIGDSLTEATYYAAEIQNNLSAGGITSLGTRSNYIYIDGVGMRVPHEGRSGWSVANYTSDTSYNGATNSFFNLSTSKFDFAYYMSQQGYTGVDAVCIGLGTNAVANVSANVAGIESMIESIHAYDANIKVFVALITPPSVQDGQRNIGSAEEFKRQQLALNEAYLTAFAGRSDNVGIIPWHIAIHRYYDFPRIEVAESARNPAVVERANNNVHPSVYGYLKMADVLYNILAAELA